MFIKQKNFSAKSLTEFLRLQRLSFAILENTAAQLRGGETEREIARLLVQRYRDAGVQSFFHLPVALFGARTALPGKWSVASFFPTRKVLEENDSVILDAAPLFHGHMVDTSYSFCFGEDAAHRQMMVDLAPFRASVCDAVNRGERFSAIADRVAADLTAKGYEPVHIKHPGDVLGHRALKTIRLPFDWRMQGFDAVSLGWFILKGKIASRGWSDDAPTWSSNATSDHVPLDGLWLVEPHAGLGPVGAKWEEMLVIEGGKARWLDDETPHVRQWRAIAKGGSYRPQPAMEATAEAA